MKILKDLGNNKYEVEIEPYEKIKGLRENEFGLAHDYVYFAGPYTLRNENGSTSSVSTRVAIQIPIRQFVEFILPQLNKDKYTQKEHLEDREHYEDDKSWNSDYNKDLKLTGPRYRKGDKYINYAWDNVATYFWDEIRKVAILCSGERKPTIISAKLFDSFKDKTDWLKLR